MPILIYLCQDRGADNSKMCNEVKMSVLMCIYNSEWNKTRQTINSVITQKGIDYELIISDDGSRDDNIERIIEYLRFKNFNSYKLVKSDKNQGIIKSVISGLAVAKGEFIKPISPGDFLYDENTLRKLYDFMKSNELKCVFGNVVYYRRSSNSVEICSRMRSPVRPERYSLNRSINGKRRYNLLHSGGLINGFSLCYHRKTWRYYLGKLENHIKYVEDNTSLMMMLLDDIDIVYLNENIGWYEYGEGISTNGDDKWTTIIDSEVLECFELCNMVYPGNELINYFLIKQVPVRSKLCKYFRLLLRHPILFIYNLVYHFEKAHRVAGINYQLLDHYLSC